MPSLRSGNGKPVKLLVVDDQELYRAGLIALLEHWDEFQIVGKRFTVVSPIGRQRCSGIDGERTDQR